MLLRNIGTNYYQTRRCRNPQDHSTNLLCIKLNVIYRLCLVLFQRVPSRATRCWSQRTVCSTTFTTRPSAGSLTAGMSLLRSLVRTATSPYAASPCCCLAASRCSRESNLFAVPSTSKVSCTLQLCTQNFALSSCAPRILHFPGVHPEFFTWGGGLTLRPYVIYVLF